MPTYVSLMKLTEKGIKDIKKAPERVEAAVKGMEAVGGKLLGFYMVMGEYDYISISEGPSDEVAMTFLLGLGAGGNVRTTTLKAFTLEEMKGMIANMP
jgi:uncharacterized protein with GYD domain